jgi:hypothetical protein
MAERLVSLSKVRPNIEMDTVAEAKQWGDRRAFDVLMEVQQYWGNMSSFRRDRERNIRYTYGDQWKDKILVDGKYITEEEYIKSQGNIPLKNNHIRRRVSSLLGVFRSQAKEPSCVARDRDEQKLGETMSIILQCNGQVNRKTEIDARSFEDFLIGGLVVHRKWYGWRNERLDCWTDYVNPNNFFIDSNMRDFRGWDVSCLGEVHDISFETLCGQFAESPEDYKKLANIYSSARDKKALSNTAKEFGYPDNISYDLLLTNDPTRCRVIEVWRKESKPRYRCRDYNSGEVYKINIEDYDDMVTAVNQERIARGLEAGMERDDIPLIETEFFFDEYWYYYYLTPFGDILKEGETPYEHKSHPYVFKAYPFINGEIHSFVGDMIDQQRYVNRLITLYDWILRASAKGVLIFPEDCLPTNMSLKDIADEWSQFNGVIAIKAKQGQPLPQQIANNSTNIGITELLNLQLKFFDDITGVTGAIQGKQGFSGMSASLYAQQTQNATTTLLDILDSYSTFVVDAAYKDVKNIQQFYDTKRVFNIAGKNAQVEYDPMHIRDVEFDLSISESTSTAAYRQLANEFLMEIWRSGQISLQQMLQTGSFPFADELLQSLQSQQQQLEQGQTPDGLSPELMAQAQQSVNLDNMNKAENILRAA